MTLTPIRRMAAAVVMTLIAVATVVSLTRSDAPASHQTTLAAVDADLPGVAAVAPDVDTAAKPPTVDLAELIEQSTDKSVDETADQTPTPRTAAGITPTTSAPTTSAPSTSTPTTSAPEPVRTTPVPTPAPTPQKNVLVQLVDNLLGLGN